MPNTLDALGGHVNEQLPTGARSRSLSTVGLLAAAAVVAISLDAINSSLWTWLRTDELFNNGERYAYLVASCWRQVALIVPALFVALVALAVLRLPAWFPAAVAALMLAGDPPFRLAFLVTVEAYWPSTILVLLLATLWSVRRFQLSGEPVMQPRVTRELLGIGVGVVLFFSATNGIYDFLADMEPSPDAIPVARLAVYVLVPAMVAFVVCLSVSRASLGIDGVWKVIAAVALTSAVVSIAPGFDVFQGFFRSAWIAELSGGLIAVGAAAAGELIGRRRGVSREAVSI